MSDENSKDWKKFKETIEEEMDGTFSELDSEQAEPQVNEKFTDSLTPTLLEEKLALAEQKAQENWEKSVRALAELDNVRRRAERDIANAHRYSLEKMITGLLPIVDSLEQALQLADKETAGGMREGLELTMKLFIDVLEKYDTTQINPQGEIFNPQEHEAMSTQDVADAVPNSVIMVFQKGYKLHDRIIRPARVIVARTQSVDEKSE